MHLTSALLADRPKRDEYFPVPSTTQQPPTRDIPAREPGFGEGVSWSAFMQMWNEAGYRDLAGTSAANLPDELWHLINSDLGNTAICRRIAETLFQRGETAQQVEAALRTVRPALARLRKLAEDLVELEDEPVVALECSEVIQDDLERLASHVFTATEGVALALERVTDVLVEDVSSREAVAECTFRQNSYDRFIPTSMMDVFNTLSAPRPGPLHGADQAA